MITERDGTQVLSAPSDQVLTDVARATGGAYVRSVASAEDVERMYREEMRGRMVAAVRGERTQRTSDSGHGWPLGVATFALLASAWLGDGRRTLRLAALLFVLAAALPRDAAAATPAEADTLYRAGRYAEAARTFESLVVADPDNLDLLARLAAARYRAGDYRGAARAWARESELAGGRADAEYNAGNAEYRGGRLEDALQRYDRALALDPNNTSAQQNKALIERELKIRQQLQPPKPEKGEPEPDPNEPPEDAPPGEAKPQEGAPEPGEEKPEKNGEPGQASDSPPPPGSKPESADGEGKPSQGGQRGDETDDTKPPGEASEVGQLGEGDPTGEGPEGAAAAAGPGEGGKEGQLTAVQAEKILDSIEEGQPRIVVPGDPTRGKPW
jgi:Flp pilus assembly protein TadD